MKLDLLVFAVHPDDAELCCSGTIAKEVNAGKKVGIVDFTQGELGTRGSGPLRLLEATESGKILGLSARENLGFRDGFFKNDEQHQMELIRVLRHYKPEVLFFNAKNDRHPDHGRAHELTLSAVFLAGLRKIESLDKEGLLQEAWRPKEMYSYIQDRYLKPDFVVDITDFFETRMKSMFAFKSQFYDPNSEEPESHLTSPEFIEFIKARCSEFGHMIGVRYGEGFQVVRPLKVKSVFDII